jgi:hypothetical protein
MSGMTVKKVLLAGIVVVQFAVPLLALIASPPTRFGFQMYSGQGGTKVVILDAAGEPIDVDVQDYVAGTLRPELDWTRSLPEHLCLAVDGAARVTVSQPDRSRSLEC